MKISKYLSLKEATKSLTAERLGIKNKPSSVQLEAMKYVASKIFDPVREHIGGPLAASSFFRSLALNKAIGGSLTSQHMKGEAIDIDTDVYQVGSNKQVFDFIRNNLKFDQLIWEFGSDEEPAWVHVSLKKEGVNRGQVLQAYKDDNNRTKYRVFNLY